MRRARILGTIAGAVVIGALTAWSPLATADGPAVARPQVSGPVEGGIRGRPWNHSLFSLDGRGYSYTEKEFFFGGEATNLESGLTAPFESRMVVRRPTDRHDFSGVVIAEWLNVTGQTDLETAWPVEAEWLMRHGAVYVGVSAQLNGLCCAPMAPKAWDPVRYAPLLHPGDAFSYDIFSQAISALRSPRGADPLSGLRPEHLVVTGASQSALFLTSFINEHYTRGQIDAFVITRGGGPFEDFSTPIFQLNEEGLSEGDPDNRRYRLWEEAGTAHAPEIWWDYVWRMQSRDMAGEEDAFDPIDTACSVNHGPVDYTTRALSRAVTRYLRTGEMPPRVPRIARDGAGDVRRDANGLAIGGIRHPHVQVPVSYNSAEGCPLWGTFRAWDSKKIQRLYPSHRAYLRKVRRWTRKELRLGWMLRSDRADALRKAKSFTRPWSAQGCERCEPPLGL